MKIIKVMQDIETSEEGVVIKKGAIAKVDDRSSRVIFDSKDVVGLSEGTLPVFDRPIDAWKEKLMVIDFDSLFDQVFKMLKS